VPASGKRDPAGDVIDHKPNGLPCALIIQSSLARSCAFGYRLAALAPIRLPCRETGVCTELAASWPFEWGNPTNATATISKFFKHTVIHAGYALRRHAFIIER